MKSNELEQQEQMLAHELSAASSNSTKKRVPIVTQPHVTAAQTSLLKIIEQSEDQFGVTLEGMQEPTLEQNDNQTLLKLDFQISGDFHEQVQSIHLLERHA